MAAITNTNIAPIAAGIYPPALLEIQTQNVIVTALRSRGTAGSNY